MKYLMLSVLMVFAVSACESNEEKWKRLCALANSNGNDAIDALDEIDDEAETFESAWRKCLDHRHLQGFYVRSAEAAGLANYECTELSHEGEAYDNCVRVKACGESSDYDDEERAERSLYYSYVMKNTNKFCSFYR
jgi:hypothetical protein